MLKQIILFTISLATPGHSFEITGEWEGRLTQGGLKPFEVRATIASLERSKQNVVRYSGIECSGSWDYLGASETAYRFRETIDSGGRKCRSTGTVELSRSPTTASSTGSGPRRQQAWGARAGHRHKRYEVALLDTLF